MLGEVYQIFGQRSLLLYCGWSEALKENDFVAIVERQQKEYTVQTCLYLILERFSGISQCNRRVCKVT